VKTPENCQHFELCPCHCSAYGCGSYPGGRNFFRKLFFEENFLKIRVKVRVILGKGRERRGAEERGEAKYT